MYIFLPAHFLPILELKNQPTIDVVVSPCCPKQLKHIHMASTADFPPHRIPVQRWRKLALSQHVEVLIVSKPSPSAPLLQSFSPVIQLTLQQGLSFHSRRRVLFPRQRLPADRHHADTDDTIKRPPVFQTQPLLPFHKCTHSYRQTRTHVLHRPACNYLTGSPSRPEWALIIDAHRRHSRGGTPVERIQWHLMRGAIVPLEHLSMTKKYCRSVYSKPKSLHNYAHLVVFDPHVIYDTLWIYISPGSACPGSL